MWSPSAAFTDERHGCCDQHIQIQPRTCLKPPVETPSCIFERKTSCIVRVSWHAADEKRAATAGSIQDQAAAEPCAVEELLGELDLEELLELLDELDELLELLEYDELELLDSDDPGG